jgi:hypothetical protein
VWWHPKIDQTHAMCRNPHCIICAPVRLVQAVYYRQTRDAENTPENTRLLRAGGCFVPEQHKHLKWHVLKIEYPTGVMWERAEWVNDPENGPTEGGHWVRRGKTGDFPSLCKADYFAPAIDQESPYVELPWEERFEAYE